MAIEIVDFPIDSMVIFHSYVAVYQRVASGYLTVRHGKPPFLIGKPSISMGHLYHGYITLW